MEGHPIWEEEDTLEAEEDSGTVGLSTISDYGNYRFVQGQRPRRRIRRTPLDGTPHLQVLPRRLLQVWYTLSIGRGMVAGAPSAATIFRPFRDGDGCSYSHSAEDSKRRPEVCKFYLSGHCKKGLACHHLHGEFPCKVR